VSTVPPSPLPPIRREILVDTDPATAFEVFTDRIGQWWPLEDLSVYGTGGTVGFTDGRRWNARRPARSRRGAR